MPCRLMDLYAPSILRSIGKRYVCVCVCVLFLWSNLFSYIIFNIYYIQYYYFILFYLFIYFFSNLTFILKKKKKGKWCLVFIHEFCLCLMIYLFIYSIIYSFISSSLLVFLLLLIIIINHFSAIVKNLTSFIFYLFIHLFMIQLLIFSPRIIYIIFLIFFFITFYNIFHYYCPINNVLHRFIVRSFVRAI